MHKKDAGKTTVNRIAARLHVGMVSMLHRPIRFATIICYALAVIIVGIYIIPPTDSSATIHFATNINRIMLPIYAMAGLLLIVMAWGYPFRAHSAERALARAGIVNAAGEAPMLLTVRRDSKNGKVYRYEFDANDLPLSYWKDKQAEIEAALNINIAAIHSSRGKHRIWINAVPAIDAIPDYIEFAMDKLPAKESEIALGEGLLGQVSLDINKTPHVLIGGSTGSGKTLLLKLILAQLIYKGAIVCIADFKGGVDYPARWAESCDIITDVCGLEDHLKSLLAELEHRKRILKSNGCSNIDEYNAAFPEEKLQRIIFACDEIAEILDKTGVDKEHKAQINQIESYLSTIARQGRAFGIHLILATQRPDANILAGQIKNNIDCRICGRADQVLSQIILDTTRAADEIEKDVQGRFINGTGALFQAYYFNEMDWRRSYD